MTRLVNKKTFAEMAGVGKSAISYACKNSIKDSMVGDKIDIDHESAKSYLDNGKSSKTGGSKKKDGRPRSGGKRAKVKRAVQKPAQKKKKSPSKKKQVATKKKPPPRKLKPKPKKPQDSVNNKLLIDELHDLFPDLQKTTDIDSFANLTIREIVEEFGGIQAAGEYAKTLKTIEDTRYKQLQVAERAGILISREFVKKYMFGQLEGLSQRLLLHAPRSIVSRAYAMKASGTPMEEAEEQAREIISKHLKSAQQAIKKAIRKA